MLLLKKKNEKAKIRKKLEEIFVGHRIVKKDILTVSTQN